MMQQSNHEQAGGGRLRVLDLALENARVIKALIRQLPNYGDLHQQLARASISVVSNIAEGDGQRGDAARRRYFALARGSNREVQWQLKLLVDDDGHRVHRGVDRVGRMLTRLLAALE